MKRRGLGQGAALVLLAGSVLVGGCSSSGSTKDKKDAQGSSSPSPAASSAASAAPKPALKALKSYMPEDPNNYPSAKVLEARTGYKVQYDLLPQNNPLDKLNLIMASGADYDLATVTDKNTFNKYALSGALTDLEPLIEKYGPNIKAGISADSFNATRVDGKIYAIPTKALVQVGNGLLIRQDWLDKLSLKMPTTPDEFAAMLQAFKDKDPGGSGKNGIPFTLSSAVSTIPNLIGAFGMPNTNNPTNGKMLNIAEDPAYQDYLKFLIGLYQKGLIDNEFASNKVETTREKFTSGRAGVLAANWADIPTVMDALQKVKPDAKVVFVSPLTGKDGKAGYGEPVGYSSYSIVPKSSKHPEDVVKWINAILEPETYKRVMVGEEGVDYTVQNGNYVPILPKFNDDVNYGGTFLVGHIEKNFPILWQARVQKDPRLFEGFKQLNNNLADKYKVEDVIGYASDLKLTAQNSQKLNQLVNDYAVKVIMGAEDIAKYPDFLSKWKAEGGEAMMKEINDWYATYPGKK
ncbi:MAG: extracellular solute-binding protein [Paenibacillaceae bacterium]|nr:extracellular solute-binding protein [Paenibacillaceae bacterium]